MVHFTALVSHDFVVSILTILGRCHEFVYTRNRLLKIYVDYCIMATPDLLTDRSNKEVPSNTYTIRPNFQHKYVAELMRVTVFGFFSVYRLNEAISGWDNAGTVIICGLTTQIN